MPKYRKKPVLIEAKQITDSNIQELAKWCNGRVEIKIEDHSPCIAIDTLEGTMYGELSDFLIMGIKGEFYPCKADIFEKSYDTV